jgi:hypothetical protein
MLMIRELTVGAQFPFFLISLSELLLAPLTTDFLWGQ